MARSTFRSRRTRTATKPRSPVLEVIARPIRPAGGTALDRCRNRLLDRHAHHRAPLGPRPVVVADPLIPEQLVEDKPRVARPLPDPAIGDDVLVGRHALRLVQVLELLAAL